MTVKVIDEKPSPKVLKQTICNHCGCTLEYVPADIIERKYSCMGESCKDGYIPCPRCKHEVVVKNFY